MKKVPILLSMLTVMSGGIGTTAWALDEAIQGDQTWILPRSQELLSTGQSLLNSNDVWVPENANVSLINIGPIKPVREYSGDDSLTVWTNLGTGWGVKRIMIVARDYEKGVTSDEANTVALRLGVDENVGWGTVLVDRFYDEMGTSRGVKMEGGTLSKNLTNELYYAVQVGRQPNDTGWEDEYWIRGKINYRSCVHSKKFSNSSMYCARRVVDDKAMYLPMRNTGGVLVVQPGEEEIESWDVEWARIQAERLEKAKKAVTDLDYNLRQAVGIMDQNEAVLSGLSLTLPKEGGTEAQVTEVQRLQKVLEELRKYYVSLSSGVNQDEIDKLIKEKKDLESNLAKAIEEKEGIKSNLTEVNKKNEELELNLAEMAKEKDEIRKELDNSAREKDDLSRELVELMQKYQGLQEQYQGLDEEYAKVEQQGKILQKNVEKLSELNTEITTENEKLNDENVKLKAEIEALKAEISRGEGVICGGTGTKGDTENINSGEKLDANNKEVEQSRDEVQKIVYIREDGSLANGAASMGTDSTQTNKVLAESGSREDQALAESGGQAAEVPKLGDVTEDGRKQMLWWLLIPILVLAAGAGAVAEVCWRKRKKY